MKRFIALSALLLTIIVSRSQIKETFSPQPEGWIFSSGASFTSVNNNPGLVIPGANNYIGTPVLMRVSSPIRICFTIWAYNSTLSSQTAFPCPTSIDMILVKSSVTTIEEGVKQENILLRVNNFGLPLNGGATCFGLSLPPAFSATEFRILFYFRASCDQGSIQYVVDNFKMVGLDEVCTKPNCAPTAMDDYFLRSNNGDLEFNAVLYGRNSGYTLPSGYVFDLAGTDNDANDGHSRLIWEIVSQPGGGNVTINPDGSCTIRRNNGTVTQLVFRYRVTDPGADGFAATTRDNLSDTATVTVKWPSSSPTPESIINFSALRNESLVTIKWTTNFETNVKGFELQRSNGNTVFQKVGFVNSKSVDGYSTVPLNYEFQETNSSRTVNLYRLVQENKDGTLLIYSIIAVRGDDGKVETLVFPNPSNTGKVTVIFQDQGEKEVSLTDINGRTIKKWPTIQDGNLIIEKLQSGMYMLWIRDKNSGEYLIKKLVVKR